jgi:hypothetical protein
MSGKVTGWLLRNAPAALEYSPADRSLLSVLVQLADRADEHGRNARLPVRDLAWRCRLSERYVKQLLVRAVAEGWLEVTKPGTSRWPTVYRFVHYTQPVDNPPTTLGVVAPERPLRSPQSALKRSPQSDQDVFDVKTSEDGRVAAPPGRKTGGNARGGGGPRRDLTEEQSRRRVARNQAAASCPRCDEIGWDSAAERWCDHAVAE